MLPQYFNPKNILDFSDAKLTVTANDGNFVCKISKYIVIDADDVNDPNRGLLEGARYKTIEGVIAPPKGGFVLISVNHLTVKENKLDYLKYIQGCEISPWLNIYDDKGNRLIRELAFLDEKQEWIETDLIPVKGVKNFQFSYYTGHFIPKGDFKPEPDIDGALGRYGIAEFGHGAPSLSNGYYPKGIGLEE
jgi:hypothetical protein